MVLFLGFIYTAVNVEAVNRAVVNWLTEVHQTHTDLSIGVENGNINLSDVQVKWVPNTIKIEKMDTEEALFNLLYNGQSVGSITCRNSNSNLSINTEDGKTTYLSIFGYDTVMLVEREGAIMLVALNTDIVITIICITSSGYEFTTGEVLNILQNIDY